MSLMPLQPHTSSSQENLHPTQMPSLDPRPYSRNITLDFQLDIEDNESEPSIPLPPEAIHLADITWHGQGGSRFSNSTATTKSTLSGSPAQRFGDAAEDSYSISNFAVIPSRPPLRPTPSYRTVESFSYYEGASPDLEYKSMLVAMEEITRKSDDQASMIGEHVCFITFCVLNFLSGFDRSCLVTAFPTISDKMDISATQVFWVATSYLTSAAIVQPLSMRFGSLIGVKPFAIAGLSIWAVASLASALVASYAGLIAARTLSGIGAGTLAVLMLSAVRHVKGSQMTLFHERFLSISFWLGLTTGLICGGAFTMADLWQYVFFITFALCLVAIMLVFAFLRLPTSTLRWATSLRQIEYLHWLLLVITIVPLIWSIGSAGTHYPWISWHILLPLLAGCFCMGIWCFSASLNADSILPVSILRRPTALAACFGTTVHGIITYAIIYLIPLLSAAMGADALAMGTTLLPLTLALTLGLFGGWHAAPCIRQGGELSAWALLTLCTGAMVLFDASNVSIVSIVLGIFTGLALGVLASTLSATLQAAATTDDETIHAAPMQVFLATLGNAFGVAIGGCIFLNRFGMDAMKFASADPIHLLHHLNGTGAKAQLVSSLFAAMRPVWITTCALSGTAFAVTIICFLLQRQNRQKIFPFEEIEIWVRE